MKAEEIAAVIRRARRTSRPAPATVALLACARLLVERGGHASDCDPEVGQMVCTCGLRCIADALKEGE